jgi:hypothetical protein
MRGRSNDYIFPECYVGEESENELVTALKLAALLDGFSLVIASRVSPQQMADRHPNTSRQITIRLECEHHRVRRADNRLTTRQVTSRKGSTKSECCPFRMTIYLHKICPNHNSNRWFLACVADARAAYAGLHKSHYRLDAEDIRNSTKLMPPENRELAMQCSQLHLASSQTAALLALRDEFGIAWDAKQISYLTRKERQQHSVLTSQASSAQQLIQSFDARNDVSYCMVSYDRCNGLVLLQKKTRTKLSLPAMEEAADLHRNYGFRDDERLLLIFLFASNEEFRLLSMHPEVLACDTTFGVEKSKKGLFTIAGVDGNNNAFNCGRAFLPNEQAWVFHLLFHHVLPSFWGALISSRVRRFITDGCPQEYGSLIRASGPGRKFANAVHNLCFYHLVVQKWATRFPKHVEGGDKLVLDKIYLALWDWAYYVETEAEYKYSRRQLFLWLEQQTTDGICSALVATHIKKYILESLDPYGALWLGHYRGRTPGMGKRTSNLAEVMHRSIKSGPFSVSAQDSTAESAVKQMNKAEFLGKLKKRRNAQSTLKRKLTTSDNVSHDLTKYADEISMKQLQLASRYHCVALNPHLFLVFTRAPETTDNSGPRSRFLRVRMVTTTTSNYIGCSCRFSWEYKMPCRHIFRVTGRRSRQMFGLRWLLSFQHCYNRQGYEEATNTMREIMREENRRNFDKGEHLPCWPKISLPSNQQFPVAICGEKIGAERMTQELVDLGLLHFGFSVKNQLLVRGLPLPELPDEIAVPGIDVEFSYSGEVTNMLSQDLECLQKVQDETVAKKKTIRKDVYGNKVLDISKQIIKITEESPALRQECIDALEELHHRFAAALTTGGDAETTRFIPSTNYAVKTVRRKGM